MILNMGPQHPATHGVLRLLLKLDGETVIGSVPELGYLHRGYEKIAENGYLSRVHSAHRPARLPLAALEQRRRTSSRSRSCSGIEVPRRAQYIRVLVCEMARIASHLVADREHGDGRRAPSRCSSGRSASGRSCWISTTSSAAPGSRRAMRASAGSSRTGPTQCTAMLRQFLGELEGRPCRSREAPAARTGSSSTGARMSGISRARMRSRWG